MAYHDYFGEALDAAKPERTYGNLKERKLEELNGLLVAADLLEKRITKVTNQIKILDGFPTEDPYDNGTVLSFKRNFPNGTKVYDYSATKANDVWYVTGDRSPNGVTWDNFVNWIGLGLVGELKVMRVTATPRKSTPRKRKASTDPAFMEH